MCSVVLVEHVQSLGPAPSSVFDVALAATGDAHLLGACHWLPATEWDLERALDDPDHLDGVGLTETSNHHTGPPG
ncbi:hypothetical protein [Haloarcula sp. JP-L23]|uniref:hypothetical protein n=1 Tax=Haloarcula sp. JP-L23 TaxID=2716717 RepID=UPI00140F19CF|nr:hypothetical protein G9465_20950 [Haloarcula sp. JP-L23]